MASCKNKERIIKVLPMDRLATDKSVRLSLGNPELEVLRTRRHYSLSSIQQSLLLIKAAIQRLTNAIRPIRSASPHSQTDLPTPLKQAIKLAVY